MQGGVGGDDCLVVNSDTIIATREKRKVYQTVVIPALMYDLKMVALIKRQELEASE